MNFLVVSQRAKANPNYSLKDLTGHGRFDILPRCILAAKRKLMHSMGDAIYIYLAQGPGWLTIPDSINFQEEDEISLAAIIQKEWDTFYSSGTFDELVKELLPEKVYLLTEAGIPFSGREELDNAVIVLGAQQDLTNDELHILENYNLNEISLGEESMLASQAITFIRQLYMIQ